MRLSALHTAAAFSAAAILLSACSGTSQSSSTGLLPTAYPSQFARPLERKQLRTHTVRQSATLHTIYVDDYGNHVVDILKYGTWANLGSISSGIVSPWGNWVDRVGNLYVADYGASKVFEYSSSGNPLTTYSSSLYAPTGVTTDRHGNVYVADSNGVHEFSQGHNLPYSCSVPGGATGLAVDKGGDVYASEFHNLIEYPHGLFSSGCEYTYLISGFSGASGIALDPQGNMIVCDLGGEAVAILAPPYTSITGLLAGPGWRAPEFVTIDRAGTRVYITDTTLKVVQVLNYPSGSVIATLGSANGITNPTGAVDSRNYVP